MGDSMNAAGGAVAKQLESVHIKDLVTPDQQVVVLEHNQTIAEALQILAKNGILSAPLVISPGLEDVESLYPASNGPSLLGWLDVQDIMKSFLQHLQEKNKKIPTGMLLLMNELETEGPVFAEKLLITVTGREDRGLLYQLDEDTPLLTAITDMFLNKGGPVVHRLAIFDAHGSITNVVSQMDVLRYLSNHPELLGEVGQRSIQSLGLLDRGPPLVVEPHTPTLIAYDQLLKAGVSGAAVVSADGDLVANLSVSDIRCIQPHHLGVLALPVAEFLALLHNTVYMGFSQRTSAQAHHPFFANMTKTRKGSRTQMDVEAVHGQATMSAADGPVPLIMCSREATIVEVLGLLVNNHVHRVHVHDPSATPAPSAVGVVTPTDVLRLLAAAAASGHSVSAGPVQ